MRVPVFISRIRAVLSSLPSATRLGSAANAQQLIGRSRSVLGSEGLSQSHKRSRRSESESNPQDLLKSPWLIPVVRQLDCPSLVLSPRPTLEFQCQNNSCRRDRR